MTDDMRDKDAFFKSIQRMQKESRERFQNDVEHRKRWLLKSMTGGFGRHQASRPKKISLPKLSILGDKK